MKWFDGKIPDAIQVSKRNGSLFMVYVYGKDDMSQQMNSTWDSEAVSKCLEENGAVAVKIESTSEECKFFSQIYPVVVVPSVFCIGEGGVPLEVIGGHVQPDEFVNKLKQVEQMHAAQKSSNTPPTPNTGQQTASLPTDGQVNLPGASNEASTSQTGASGDPAVPLEEKVERAKELMEKKKAEKAQKEFEKSREEEIKRRKLGSDLQKLKQTQQETQMKELKEQMRKDKEEEKKAKEKIRQQIARDREERQVKFTKEKQERDQAAEEKKREKLVEQQRLAAAEEARKSETARIQVRLPDGSSVTQSYPSTEPLQTLHSVITQRIGQNVTLSTTFPKRRFTEEDMSRSFAELELAPTAVLIALPTSGTTRQASSSSSTSSQSGGMVSFILSPFFFLWNFLYSLLFGGGNSDSPPGASASQSSSSSQPQTSTRANRPTTAYQRRGGNTGRPEGNTRRLADLRDDDDDMSTYNGNSTQQL